MIETKQLGKICFVKVPEDKFYEVKNNPLQVSYPELWIRDHEGHPEFISIRLSEGYWKLLSTNAFEMTEEQMERICEYKNGFAMTKIYRSYLSPEIVFDPKFHLSDSYSSILESLKVYKVNPLGKNPCEEAIANGRSRTSCFDMCQGSCWEYAEIDSDEWEEAEKHVGNYAVLIKEEHIDTDYYNKNSITDVSGTGIQKF